MRRKAQRKITRLFRTKNVLFILALLLILSFCLHALSHHEHPKDLFGEGPQAAFHGEDKKWWALFIALSLSLAYVSFFRKQRDAASQISRQGETFPPARGSLILFDPLHEALRKGVMHPKICG